MRNDVWEKIKIATYYFIKCVSRETCTRRV